MKSLSKAGCIMLVATALISLTSLDSGAAESIMKHGHGDKTCMEMHHLHVMMNHGLSMVTEGANLVMLAEMKMAPALDQMTEEHGKKMIAEGKEMIHNALNGPMMQALHKEGHGDHPMMAHTHELGNAIMTIAELDEKMNMEGAMNKDMMTMHHMHMLINHALNMAAEGANLEMCGHHNMCEDKEGGKHRGGDHGATMIKDARALVKEVLEGKAMKEMHERGIKMGNDMMVYTHKLGDGALKVIDLLEKMP